MPIYEYQCDACGGSFDALQKLADAPLTHCRLCEAEGQVRKRVSAPAFRLKGSGWYETDFKKNGQRNVAKGDSDGGKAGSDSAASSSAGDSAKASTSESKASSDKSASGSTGSGSSKGASDAA